jgi:NDP-sugar pyrophosphorylase family protein
MIFAAGLGTRLRPLTNEIPKALVEVAGEPMLARTARTLVEAGASRLIINVHHHADQIIRFVEENDRFGVDVHISHEREEPLETGGGLLAARTLFRGDRPIVVHNVDVILAAPLPGLIEAHVASQALVSLAVMQRDTERCLLFDDVGLFGRVDRRSDLRLVAREVVGTEQAWPFCGVHIASPELLTRIEERGRFSITASYLRLAAEGARIAPLPVDGHFWADIGTPETLARAEQWLQREG